MYIIERKDYYKFAIILGLISCSIISLAVFLLTADGEDYWDFKSFTSFTFSIAYTLYFTVKYLRREINYVVLRIDESGIFLCSKKDDGSFIPWERIRYVIFVRDEYGSKIIVRQHNKETCELLLTHYFYVFRPKSAIKAAYEYADNKNKIMEVKDYLEISYEDIMWKISHKKLKQHPKGWFC